MRLSDAIRLGAMMKPQAFGHLHDPLTKGTCALGAAHDAMGLLRLTSAGYCKAVPEVWEAAFDTVIVGCPECRMHHRKVMILTHLNDDHRWTRERIADWAEAIENAQEAAKPEQVEVAR